MGLAIAKLLSSRGAILSIADRNEKSLNEASKELSGSGHMHEVVDVTKSDQVDRWINKTVQELGKLDGAVNFAGVAVIGKIVDMSDQDWDVPFNVNTKGVFYCLRAQLRVMKAGASIVSHSELASEIPILTCSSSGDGCECECHRWLAGTLQLRGQQACGPRLVPECFKGVP